jgi:hypothetical protein
LEAIQPNAHRPAAWPDNEPLPEVRPSGDGTHFVLPLRWSLHYALSDKQWNELRERHKKRFPGWERCACPNSCSAEALDERWKYDNKTHTKRFTGAAFICPGCHWLKSLPWRIQTWLKRQQGRLPAMTRPPHIITCLGWTQQDVDSLRDQDLNQYQTETRVMAQLENQVQQSRAVILPAHPAQLDAEELEKLVRPSQAAIAPWRVDLEALAVYGYSRRQIREFERRMYKLAAKRLTGEDDGFLAFVKG